MYTIMLFHFRNRCSAYRYRKCNREDLARPCTNAPRMGISLALQLHTTQYERRPLDAPGLRG
jgi:hypothetical protein